jgi:hypothetical protein
MDQAVSLMAQPGVAMYVQFNPVSRRHTNAAAGIDLMRQWQGPPSMIRYM